MKTYSELKSLIEQRGVHPEFGDAGEFWGIEQNPHELATFLVRMQELGVQSCLEIGTGYKGGLSRFLAQDMGWRVTTVDIVDYGHMFEGVHYVVGDGVVVDVKFNYKFDLLFIDGDHSYEAVDDNLSQYGEYAEKIVAFHDILGARGCDGSYKHWLRTEFSPFTRGRAFNIEDINGRAAGIGWIEL